jgi:hypothetical protein
LQALVYRYIERFVLSTRCFLRVLGVLLRSGSWFRLRPEGGLGGLDVPNSANVPVGGLPTFILDFGYVAVLQTAGVMRWAVEITERLQRKRLGAQIGQARCLIYFK